MDANLSGLLLGLTPGARAPDIFHALIEATAFEAQIIIEAFEANGVRVNELSESISISTSISAGERTTR